MKVWMSIIPAISVQDFEIDLQFLEAVSSDNCPAPKGSILGTNRIIGSGFTNTDVYLTHPP